MKRKALALTLILVLLFSVVLGTWFVNLGMADPYLPGGEAPPPAGTQPAKISMNLENNTVLRSGNISLSVTASASNNTFLTDIWYVDDWQDGNISIYTNFDYDFLKTSFSGNITLAGIPEGNHTLNMFANAEGYFVIQMTSYYFDVVGTSSVNFTVDKVIPTISFLSSNQNKTYYTGTVTLYFVVNKPASQIIYCLDNNGNLTANADTSLTLTNLANGEHNVTIYSQDEYGIIGAPSTVYFEVKVPELFSTLAAIAVISTLALVVVISAGLLFYRKRRNHARTNKHSEIEQSSTRLYKQLLPWSKVF